MAVVYRHRRLDTNEIFYIGIGKEIKRAYSKAKRNPLWKSIINKTNYEVEILYNNISTEDAKELEIFLISLYGRRDLGLGPLSNMTDGGDGIINLAKGIWNKGISPSKETLEKQRLKKLGVKRKPHSDETKEKMRIKALGRKGTRNGITISAETKEKMRLAALIREEKKKLNKQ
jgi:hypothetical protein